MSENIMNINLKRIVSLFLAAALLCFVLSGCSTPEMNSEEKYNCVVISGLSANKPRPDTSMIQEDLMETARTYGRVQVIRLDGKPALADTLSIDQRSGFYTEAQLEERAKSQTDFIETSIAAVQAEAPECDLLAALRLSADTVEAKEGETNTLLIFSNGLNTVSPLDMSEIILKTMDTAATVEALQDQAAIPDLSGFDQVRFFMLGETALPQEPLTPQDKAALKDLWTKIFCAAGLEESQLSFISTPTPESEPVEGLPPVSTVTVLQEDNAIASGEVQGNGINVTLSQNSVTFIPDTAELVSPSAAVEALRTTAETLTQRSDIQVLIVGQTATVGQADSCRQLSLERAQCVAGILQQLGVDAAQLNCIGLGYDPSPLRVQDIAPDGSTLVEEQAMQNRVVHILDANTPLAQEILEQCQ